MSAAGDHFGTITYLSNYSHVIHLIVECFDCSIKPGSDLFSEKRASESLQTRVVNNFNLPQQMLYLIALRILGRIDGRNLQV